MASQRHGQVIARLGCKVTGDTEGKREGGDGRGTWLGDDAAASGQTGQDQSATERQARQTAVTACMVETARLQKS